VKVVLAIKMTANNKPVNEYEGGWPLSTSSREEVFSETGLPVNGVLGNAGEAGMVLSSEASHSTRSTPC